MGLRSKKWEWTDWMDGLEWILLRLFWLLEHLGSGVPKILKKSILQSIHSRRRLLLSLMKRPVRKLAESQYTQTKPNSTDFQILAEGCLKMRWLWKYSKTGL